MHASQTFDRKVRVHSWSNLVMQTKNMQPDNRVQVMCAATATLFYVWDNELDDAASHAAIAKDIIWG